MRTEWVLVVGDDATERLALYRLLESAGFRAAVASHADVADVLDAEPFDVVLADRTLEHAATVPVVVAGEVDDLIGGLEDALATVPAQ